MAKKEIMVVLDNIRSCENVGSIFRTADAAGVKKIFLCGITQTPIGELTLLRQGYGGHSKISKTALGAENYVPWEYCKQTWRCLLKLKRNLPTGGEKLKIIGLEQTKNSKNIFQRKSKVLSSKYLVLVVGNEVRGLSPKILNYCDEVVEIPMYGKKESLNVSVATGVALYQIKSPQREL